MPDIYQLQQQHKARLLARERTAASVLVRQYGLAYERLQVRLATLTTEIETRRRAGETIGASWLYERDRLTGLVRGIETELQAFGRLAARVITDEQRAATGAAIGDAERALVASLGTDAVSVRLGFGQLNTGAINAIAGFAADGSPLYDLLIENNTRTAKRVRDELVAGVIEGAHPRRIAERVRDAFGGNLARSLTVARTETLRAYRESSRESFMANADVLDGWVWTASLSSRTCAACLAMHGTVFPVEARMESHPNCRCVMSPLTTGSAPPQTGAAWFAGQPETLQKEVLGPGKFEAYKAGKIKLQSLVGVSQSGRWGKGRYERSLEDAQASARGISGNLFSPLAASQASVRTSGARVMMNSPVDDLPPMPAPKNVKVLYGSNALKQQVKEIFGRTVSDEQLAMAVGALDDAEVTVTTNYEGNIVVEIKHPLILRQERSIYKDDAGDAYIKNEYFRAVKTAPKGTGLLSFARQVAGARKLKVKKIGTYAAGNRDDKTFNGYFTWARFGYNAPISQFDKSNLPAKYHAAKTLNDLMAMDGGAEAWREHGSAQAMVFDLDGRKSSMKTLQSYMRKRGMNFKL